jgi:hypothetical protein
MRNLLLFSLIIVLAACAEIEQSDVVVAGADSYIETPSYQEIDSLTRNLAAEDGRILDVLALKLAEIGLSDQGKSRAIFTWLASNIKYDAALFDQQMLTNPSPEEVLSTKKSVCTGFSAVAMALADRMGLKMKAITGYSKGLAYNPGRPFEKNGHIWNAVSIDGVWQLIDFTWGQGYSDNEDGKTASYTKFDEQWFCPKPAQFAPTHFPVDTNWQLLKQPLNEEEYAQLPAMNPSAFHSHQNYDSILVCLRNSNEPVADYFPQYDCEVLISPVFNKLEKDSTYEFIIRSDSAVKIQIHELKGDRWTDFELQKNLHSLNYTVKSTQIVGVCVTYKKERLYLELFNSKEQRW